MTKNPSLNRLTRKVWFFFANKFLMEALDVAATTFRHSYLKIKLLNLVILYKSRGKQLPKHIPHIILLCLSWHAMQSHLHSPLPSD